MIEEGAVCEMSKFYSVSAWLIIRKDFIAMFNVVDSRGRRTQDNGLHTVYEVTAWL
jgi:hypothetical protein